jgi:hypothetical protein
MTESPTGSHVADRSSAVGGARQGEAQVGVSVALGLQRVARAEAREAVPRVPVAPVRQALKRCTGTHRGLLIEYSVALGGHEGAGRRSGRAAAVGRVSAGHCGGPAAAPKVLQCRAAKAARWVAVVGGHQASGRPWGWGAQKQAALAAGVGAGDTLPRCQNGGMETSCAHL